MEATMEDLRSIVRSSVRRDCISQGGVMLRFDPSEGSNLYGADAAGFTGRLLQCGPGKAERHASHNNDFGQDVIF
jgi:hypothetical protein